jgi:hypothetical protein
MDTVVRVTASDPPTWEVETGRGSLVIARIEQPLVRCLVSSSFRSGSSSPTTFRSFASRSVVPCSGWNGSGLPSRHGGSGNGSTRMSAVPGRG